jgi:hypothetical protein
VVFEIFGHISDFLRKIGWDTRKGAKDTHNPVSFEMLFKTILLKLVMIFKIFN